MDNLGKLGLIVMITTFSICTILFFSVEVLPHLPHEYKEDNTSLNISNFSTSVRFISSSDQYGNNYHEYYHYHIYADIHNWSSTENYTVQIKAYDSNWNYIPHLSKNCTLTSLNYNPDGSGWNIDYNYHNDTLTDYKYAVFEIYDSHGLCYNQTAIFDLDDIYNVEKIDYIGGDIW